MWTFYNPVQVVFGRGTRKQATQAAGDKPCLIVTSQGGRQRLQEDILIGPWARQGHHTWATCVAPNPTLEFLEEEIQRLRGEKFEVVLAYGGGSALDTAKILAFALGPQHPPLSLRNWLQHPAEGSALPIYAIPTTAGTGSEVTPFATVWDHENLKKLSLAGPALFASLAVVDPDTQEDLPLSITISSGLDAVNQALESLWNRNATVISMGLAGQSLKIALEALPNLIGQDKRPEAREAMAQASLLAGLCISQTRTALCHAISYPITAHFGVPHGLACAFSMPSMLKRAVAADDGRFDHLARTLLKSPSRAEDLVAVFERLNDRLGVRKRVRSAVKHPEKLVALIPEMQTIGRADNTMVPVDESILQDLIEQSWEGPDADASGSKK